MRPPFEIVVRSPPRGLETSAHTPSAILSRLPNGSRTTVLPSGDEAHARRRAAGITEAASERWATHVPEETRNSRRESAIGVGWEGAQYTSGRRLEKY